MKLMKFNFLIHFSILKHGKEKPKVIYLLYTSTPKKLENEIHVDETKISNCDLGQIGSDKI